MTRTPFLQSNLKRIGMAMAIAAAACFVSAGEAHARAKKPALSGVGCQGAPTQDGFLDSGSHFQDYDRDHCIRTDYVCDNGTLCWTESRIDGCRSKNRRPPAPRQCSYNPKPGQAALGDLGELVVDGIAPPPEPISPKAPTRLDPALYY
jgi:hypothetical protein